MSHIATHQPLWSIARIALVIFALLYSASTSLSHSNIESRVLDILKSFNKVDPTKVSLNVYFLNDLGLDSLDMVEVVMAIKEEFSVEIPNKNADEIKSTV
ncbi:hypothetical protein BC938DRAFT_476976 [Jimgerdemannia flammicorona]|uniref:Acyl carrier protein n=1 Tax=Jimgerdemannia flammicorona TaxID=994334 RepID=A0A433PCW2_9FUNG|nr:hypothetical protein BC938DRAFT_476976 [Jimgerdemannia flammicorona]